MDKLKVYNELEKRLLDSIPIKPSLKKPSPFLISEQLSENKWKDRYFYIGEMVDWPHIEGKTLYIPLIAYHKRNLISGEKENIQNDIFDDSYFYFKVNLICYSIDKTYITDLSNTDYSLNRFEKPLSNNNKEFRLSVLLDKKDIFDFVNYYDKKYALSENRKVTSYKNRLKVIIGNFNLTSFRSSYKDMSKKEKCDFIKEINKFDSTDNYDYLKPKLEYAIEQLNLHKDNTTIEICKGMKVKIKDYIKGLRKKTNSD